MVTYILLYCHDLQYERSDGGDEAKEYITTTQTNDGRTRDFEEVSTDIHQWCHSPSERIVHRHRLYLVQRILGNINRQH